MTARQRRSVNATALLLALLLLAAGCRQAAPPAPPPDPGRIVARHAHSFYYFDINYSVGIRDGKTRILGTISNTIPTDLQQFMVTVTVKREDGRETAKAHSPFFDVSDMESARFIIDLPRLQGALIFDFSCEYVYFDDLQESRRWLTGGENDWNNFSDRIALP